MSGVQRGQRLLQWGTTVPWAMEPLALEQLAALARRERLTAGELEAIAAQLGRPLDNSHAVTLRDGVAIIPIVGPIFRYADAFSAISGATTVDEVAQDLAAALAAPQVTAILLSLDSPGGEANGIAELAGMISAAGATKPLVAYIGGDGCSAAYWLAAAAGEIVADPTARIGSIGTVMAVTNPDAESGRAPRALEFVSSQSPKKRPNPTTEAGRATLQARVDAMTAVFIADVARYRGVSEEAIAAVEGDILIGQAAVEAGLADRLGDEESTIAALAQRGRELRSRSSYRAETGGQMSSNYFARLLQGVGAQLDAGSGGTTFLPLPPVTSGGVLPVEANVAGVLVGDGPMVAGPVSTREQELEAETTVLRAQLAALRTEQQALFEREVQAAAERFAADAVTRGHAFPAEQAALVDAYLDAARDDAALGPVTLADGTTASRVARVTARVQQRPAHHLTTEVVPVRTEDGVIALLNPETTEFANADRNGRPLTQAEHDRLLAMTPAGRQVLAERAANRAGLSIVQ